LEDVGFSFKLREFPPGSGGRTWPRSEACTEAHSLGEHYVMSIPKEPPKVKLISSLFSPDQDLLRGVMQEMEGHFGPADWKSEKLIFDRTRYYASEMGWPLYRQFISFSRLIGPDTLVDIKLLTNTLEQGHLVKTSRTINIDPGYLSLERLILATGKNYIHRVYLNRGIYADLTLVFHAGTFKPLPWTYPDYADERVIRHFNMLRSEYLYSLRQGRKDYHA
jgi:hypothetical protein